MLGKMTVLSTALVASIASAENRVFETFAAESAGAWDYVSDQVMGGVSEGQAAFASAGSEKFVHLTGDVSTKNNGGFIQVRKKLSDGMPEDMNALHLRVRGNGAEYYIHIRTTESRIPWFYYQAPFVASQEWTDITVPLSAFKPSNASLPASIDPKEINSIGIVAYGRDHSADVSVASIALE